MAVPDTPSVPFTPTHQTKHSLIKLILQLLRRIRLRLQLLHLARKVAIDLLLLVQLVFRCRIVILALLPARSFI